MKVLVLGAAGKLGRHLVASCHAQGHDVTAAVRNPQHLRNTMAAPGVQVVACDAMDSPALQAALAGQDAVISAAGNVADGARFVALFDQVVTCAEQVLAPGCRVWMLAGAAILDVPHTGRIGLDLPFVPALYRPHLENWRRLQRSRLDWALMCPGPMVPGDGLKVAGGLAVSVDRLPYDVGGWARYAPLLALSLLMQRRLPALRVPYQGVADVMAEHLRPGGQLSQRRAGIAWPAPGAAAQAGGAA